MAAIRLLALASLAHIGLLSAKRATPSSGPRRLSAADGSYSRNASELIYRPGRYDDKPVYQYMKLLSYKIFVAVDPKAPAEEAVAGEVSWRMAENTPDVVLNKINKSRQEAVVVYIGSVNVLPTWQNHRVGSTMLPKALDKIRDEVPNVMAAYLGVSKEKTYAIKLYQKTNFTCVHGRWDDMMDYEYVEDYFGYEAFVAVDPKAPHATKAWQLVELIDLSHNCCDQAVVGKVLWMLAESVPGCVLSAINKTQEDAVVAYIGTVEATPPWQNKRVGSTMLPKALNEQPRAAANRKKAFKKKSDPSEAKERREEEMKQQRKEEKEEKISAVRQSAAVTTAEGNGVDKGAEATTEPPSGKKGFFSNKKFTDLQICDPLKEALTACNFTTMTDIQAKAIPLMLKGKDVLGAAKTGSGKTLAFLVPALELLVATRFQPKNGTGVMVISPTRELAMQIFDVCKRLVDATKLSQTYGIVMGGVNRKNEADKLSRGINILIATPGRLLDHLQNTRGFVYANLMSLVIDEADRILQIGFEEDMNQILKILPKKRQTSLFSATQTQKVNDLARLSLKKPIFVQSKGADDDAATSTASGLVQGYVVVGGDDRLRLLFTFLKKNQKKKVMVFFSSCNSVKFHDELLNYIDIPVISIHGQKKQSARMTNFYRFCQMESGILLCTDVAARGLDIPKVDWIVQYDPPDDPKEYIHRVGRTARGAEGTGKALLFLMPEELGFLRYLRKSGVTTLNEYVFPPAKVANIQHQLEKLVETNYHLHRASRDAYRSYLHAYAAHASKDCFDVHSLDLQKLAKCFGFAVPPKVDLNLKDTKKSDRQVEGPLASGGWSENGEVRKV
ncbi:ATP-dependent RNA helicase ddx18 [Perkinsus olseni]|uniref:ATP-dependent RNA helicase n=1 Tax=Perkinsus olseni TaxID=32597 RepID=A0A7J6LZ87_PEROL|nr:ATP-dependent RNA helicase ddx18 [Perkinsus olseni]